MPRKSKYFYSASLPNARKIVSALLDHRPIDYKKELCILNRCVEKFGLFCFVYLALCIKKELNQKNRSISSLAFFIANDFGALKTMAENLNWVVFKDPRINVLPSQPSFPPELPLFLKGSRLKKERNYEDHGTTKIEKIRRIRNLYR